jgi:short-subunit dehydrogenase
MRVQLKPVGEQVLVITGGSSGIGLVTALRAAARGARLVIAARNEEDLEEAAARIRAQGAARVVTCVADVSRPEDVERIAETAGREFGGFDTWVNNAGVALYGALLDTPVEDMRRLFEVDFWGALYGMRTAVPQLQRGGGGALINVASVAAERALPLLGAYSAAKHALKAVTDALRVELEAAGAPISVSLVEPASIDTPLFGKSRSYMGAEAAPMPPVYAPELVADAILRCAEHPTREVIVGGAGRAIRLVETLWPRLLDLYFRRAAFRQQRGPLPAGAPDNLYAPAPSDGGQRGRSVSGRVRRTSLYTWSALHPVPALAALGGVGLGVWLARRTLSH